MKADLLSVALSAAACVLAIAAWLRVPVSASLPGGAEAGRVKGRRVRTEAEEKRDARVAEAAAKLRQDVAGLAQVVQGMTPSGGAASGGGVPAGMRQEIGEVIEALAAERRAGRIEATVATLRQTFRHNVGNLVRPFELTDDQRDRWLEILDRQALAAKAVLEAEVAGPEHDARARALVEETNRLLCEVLTGEQLKKYGKARVDWFGGSLHSAVPGK